MQKVLVSACLLGARVRYHGGDALCTHPILRRWLEEGRVIAVCPEQEGGLPTPRPPAEVVDGSGRAVLARLARVRTAGGDDVTDEFCRGADRALVLVKQHQIQMAVLKDASPSCGSTVVYDGTFSGRSAAGTGVTTALLQAHGVRVFAETELESASRWLGHLEAGSIH